jgi:hypothetical protein
MICGHLTEHLIGRHDLLLWPTASDAELVDRCAIHRPVYKLPRSGPSSLGDEFTYRVAHHVTDHPGRRLWQIRVDVCLMGEPMWQIQRLMTSARAGHFDVSGAATDSAAMSKGFSSAPLAV